MGASDFLPHPQQLSGLPRAGQGASGKASEGGPKRRWWGRTTATGSTGVQVRRWVLGDAPKPTPLRGSPELGHRRPGPKSVLLPAPLNMCTVETEGARASSCRDGREEGAPRGAWELPAGPRAACGATHTGQLIPTRVPRLFTGEGVVSPTLGVGGVDVHVQKKSKDGPLPHPLHQMNSKPKLKGSNYKTLRKKALEELFPTLAFASISWIRHQKRRLRKRTWIRLVFGMSVVKGR